MDNVETSEFSVSSTVAANEVVSGSIYDFPITTSNYSIKLSGYFKASQTGEHKFTISSNEGAYLKVLRGITCDEDQSALGTGGFTLVPSKPQEEDEVVSESIGSFFLNEGVYYPLELILFNSQLSSSLKTSVTLPDGSGLSDLGKKIMDVEFHNSKIMKREYDGILGEQEEHCWVHEVKDDYEEDSTSDDYSSDKESEPTQKCGYVGKYESDDPREAAYVGGDHYVF